MTKHRAFKDAVYEQLGRVGRAVGSPRRIELLELLCQAPRTVEVLAELTGQSVANTSHHLQGLRRAQLVEAERAGLYVTYRVADEEVCRFVVALRQLADARLAELEQVTRQFLTAEDLEETDLKQALSRARRGEVLLLDVRPAEEYRAGHLPGALSLPLAELQARLAELPRKTPILADCRGRYCVLAVEAVRKLRRQGYQAVRLAEGVPDFRARGLALRSGAEP
ncbi:MAG: metalloregulator ArsR/SmtB family transcription factor [Deltaproteobacteria bacterium]|nr:metalloregulator ArsR/SmtB family transcription factor [Deltaproteobacteria bacterium]